MAQSPERQRKVLQKRAEILKSEDVLRRTRLRVAALKAELKTMRRARG